MTTRAELRCHCGQVRGFIADASSRTVNRAILLLRRPFDLPQPEAVATPIGFCAADYRTTGWESLPW